MGESSESVVKIPLNPPFSKGDENGSPLWRLFPAMGRQRGVRGDFIENFDSIGVKGQETIRL
jgi:hypothetical protein